MNPIKKNHPRTEYMFLVSVKINRKLTVLLITTLHDAGLGR